jgi:hypothetical protein
MVLMLLSNSREKSMIMVNSLGADQQIVVFWQKSGNSEVHSAKTLMFKRQKDTKRNSKIFFNNI